MNRQPTQKFTSILLFLTSLALVAYFALFSAYATYTRFIADDYCSAYNGARLGMLRYIWYWFNTWGGRYSAIAADMMLVWFGQKGIGFIPLLSLILWVTANVIIFWLVLPEKNLGNKKFVFSMFFALSTVFSLYQLMPNIPQTFFWYSAFRTHMLAVITFNFFLGILLFLRGKDKVHTGWFFICALYCFVNGGFSEAFTAIQILSLASFLLIELIFLKREIRDKYSLVLISSLAGALLAIGIMLISPGMRSRQEFFDTPRTLIGIISISWRGFITFFRAIFKDTFRSVGFVATCLLALFYGFRFFNRTSLKTYQVILIMLGGFGLIYASFLPAAYGMGDILPRRAFPIPIFFGFGPVFYGMSYLGYRLREKLPSVLEFTTICCAVIFVLISCVGGGLAFYNSRRQFVEYAQQIDQLEIQVAEAKTNGLGQINIGKLGNWAGVYDPSENPKFWVTACFSQYYGIQVVGPKSSE